MAGYRTSVVVVATVALIAGGATAASGVWSNIGGGTDDASTGVVAPIVFSAGTPESALYPGASVGVNVTITNPNTGAVKLEAISLDTALGTGGFAVDAGHATCDTAALGFATQTNGGVGWDLPPRVGATDGSLDVSLASALTMSAGAVNACQGATFTVYVKAGP